MGNVRLKPKSQAFVESDRFDLFQRALEWVIFGTSCIWNLTLKNLSGLTVLQLSKTFTFVDCSRMETFTTVRSFPNSTPMHSHSLRHVLLFT